MGSRAQIAGVASAVTRWLCLLQTIGGYREMQQFKPVSQPAFAAGFAVLALVVAPGWPAMTAVGQEDGSLVVDIGECVDIPSPEARFACYERLAQQQAGPEIESAPAAESPKALEPMMARPLELGLAPRTGTTGPESMSTGPR